MKLQNTTFRPVWQASGATNFFENGWWYGPLAHCLGGTWQKTTFVAKTTTLMPRAGNMPLMKNGTTPRDLNPDCIKVNFAKAVVVNAVGLSGPGAQFLFERGLWQKRTEPFILSFMAVEHTRERRLDELHEFGRLLQHFLPQFHAQVGVQLNYSCPNTGHKTAELADEIDEGLSSMGPLLTVPLIPKVNVHLPIPIAVRLGRNKHLSALNVSNTIPWGSDDRIDWKSFFGSEDSPLTKYGGGGLSGKPLLPLVANWVIQARSAGFSKPINAGGGILYPNDINALKAAGAEGVSLGTIGMLRPWNMKSVIARAIAEFA